MIGIGRTPEQVAAADHVRRQKKVGPEAEAKAKRLKADVDATAKRGRL